MRNDEQHGVSDVGYFVIFVTKIFSDLQSKIKKLIAKLRLVFVLIGFDFTGRFPGGICCAKRSSTTLDLIREHTKE